MDKINHQLLLRHGNCISQPIVIVDIDAQTHTLESCHRENAVVGFNGKKRIKPCYQWNVAFVCHLGGGYLYGEVLNTHCPKGLQIIICCRCGWILSEGVRVYERNWQQIDENTRLYDLG